MHDAGAFYFFDTKAFQEHRKLVMENTIGYPIERSRAVDIDTLEDFELAKVLHENWLKRKTNAVR
jgi:CMP-N-acetylneuraminic acid synthetase